MVKRVRKAQADRNTSAIPSAPGSPYSRPIDERPGMIANSIMSTPGEIPVWDASVAGMTYREIGVSGLRAFSGWVKEEVLQELQGRQGAQKFREMGDNSPTVAAILHTIKSTMRKVEWRVTPNEEAPQGPAQEKADWLQSCMDDMSHTWLDLVLENLSAIQYGYAPHEVVYKKRQGKNPPKDRDGVQPASSDYDDGTIGWRRIPLRGQDTVLQWFFDATGTIRGMRQLPWTGVMRDIPIEKMLLFRPDSHKNNPEGRSVLRAAYMPYYYVKRLQEFEAIMAERMGGVPVVKVPVEMIEAANNGDSKAQASMTSFKNLAVNLRVDEQAGVVMPSNPYMNANGPTAHPMFSLELITPQGGRGSALNFETAITRYNTNILTSVLADFLTLGHEARGTQSLAVTKVDMFFQAVEGWLNSNAAVYNKYAIPRLFELNGFDPTLMPKVEPDLAQRIDLDVLSNFVLRLAQAGMPLFPNDDLQTFLLDAGGMPDVTDPRALQAAQLADDQLDQKDEMQDTAQDQQEQQLTNMKKPQPAPAGGSPKANANLKKMVLASLARRVIRHQGPRFGISTRKGTANV